MSANVETKAREILNRISAELTQDALVALNAESVNDKKSSKDVAATWLRERRSLAPCFGNVMKTPAEVEPSSRYLHGGPGGADGRHVTC